VVAALLAAEWRVYPGRTVDPPWTWRWLPVDRRSG
jgi:hypothetical protein